MAKKETVPMICMCGSNRYKTRKRATLCRFFDDEHTEYATTTVESHPDKGCPTCFCVECNRDVTSRVRDAKAGKKWTRRTAKMIHYCLVHKREATDMDRGRRRCDPSLAGITMVCDVVERRKSK
jgi:hypothetical protein